MIAKDFALVNLTKDKFPVIFAIHFNSQKGLIAMNDECSAYNESEVLVQDGLEYSITKKEYVKVEGKQVCCIHFVYPAKKNWNEHY